MRRPLAVITLAAAVLAGCGDASSSETSSTGARTASTSTPKATEQENEVTENDVRAFSEWGLEYTEVNEAVHAGEAVADAAFKAENGTTTATNAYVVFDEKCRVIEEQLDQVRDAGSPPDEMIERDRDDAAEAAETITDGLEQMDKGCAQVKSWADEQTPSALVEGLNDVRDGATVISEGTVALGDVTERVIPE